MSETKIISGDPITFFTEEQPLEVLQKVVGG